MSNTATSCSSCSSIIANCKTCTQTSPGTAVLCSVCNAGFYLVTDKKSCPACSYACISCTTATPCLACKSTFVLVGGVCICNNTASPPLYLKYSAITCLVCSSIFSNCVSCAPSPANSNVTNCTACASGYSLATNAQSCIKCPSYCLACTSTTVCITCFATFTLSSGTCKCDATANFYLSTTLKKCVLCSVLITNCLTCTPNATKTTQILCSACNSGYYTNLTACLPCRTYCKTCTSATVCTTCIPTFSLISSVCQCDATAQMFLAPSATVCQSCSLFVKHCTTCVNASVTTVNCTVCSAGYFIASVSLCSACPSSCTACTGTLSCTACVTGYDLTNGTCICGPSCLACLALAPYCTSCTISGGVTLTACLSCATGYYIAVSNTACSPCPISCTSCLSTTNCLLCADTYSKVGTLCKCDNTTLFYNSLSLSCQSCPSLILNCITCQLSASILTCSNCLSGYAPSATATTCVLCPSTCTACTTGPICTACVTGYSLTGPDCLCGLDCVLCGVINNCIMCTIDNSTSAVTCQACKVGYYPSAD